MNIDDKEDLCVYCNEHIIPDCARSRIFLCEGRWCEEAREAMLEEEISKEDIGDIKLVDGKPKWVKDKNGSMLRAKSMEDDHTLYIKLNGIVEGKS